MLSINAASALAFASLFTLGEAAPLTPSTHPTRAIGATLRPTNDAASCLGVTQLANGAYLSSRLCTEGGFYNKWDVSPGDNQVVRLSGLPEGSGDWCLDAGLDYTSGSIVSLKIWQCYPGLPQQR